MVQHIDDTFKTELEKLEKQIHRCKTFELNLIPLDLFIL